MPPQQIVDGQQRLATLTLLIASVRDYLLSLDETERARTIESTYLHYVDIHTLEGTPKLKLNNLDNDYFHKRVTRPPAQRPAELEPARASHHRIDRAMRLAGGYVARVARRQRSPVEALLARVRYIENNVKVIWVVVPDEADAFVLFETLNDRGIDLAITDLLKNYVFRLAADRISEAQQYWISITGIIEAAEDERLIKEYIRHFWFSKIGATRERDLYDSIKRRVSSKQGALDFCAELHDNARRYTAIINPAHDVWNEYGPSARRHVWIVNLLGMVQIRPLILAIMQEFDVKATVLARREMVSWGVRFLIVGGVGGGTLESHYCDRATEIRRGKITTARQLNQEMATVVPSDTAFREAFTSARVSKSALARYYLCALERQANGEINPELVPNEDYESVNLEHVLPQSPEGKWNIEEEKARALYRRIGNMALMRVGDKVAAGNEDFEIKREVYEKSALRLAQEVADYEEWNGKTIAERQTKLADLAVAAWPYEIS